MQKIEVIVRITKDHCLPQEQTIFEWIETNRAAPDTLNYPGLEINLEHRRVFKNGQEVYMSRYEYGVLSLMARHPGQLFTKEQIFEAVWHQDSESCLTAVTNTIGRMLKEGFYHRPLTVIRPIDIENFLKGMRRNGRSDSYISKARGMLYQIFQKAEANDLVRRNPVRLAEKMRATGTAKRKEAFTTAEVAHLMKVLPDDRMGLSIRLLLGTGMRMQELLALEPQFIEEDGSVIHIRQAVKVVKGTVSIGSPKSKDSIRDIPVPLNVRPCAIKLRDTTDQFIWESPKTGLPCNPTHFRDVFRKSLEEAGDVRLLTPHSFRHTYVSQMQALGVDIQTIQSIVGHADTEMTEHYLHVQESIRQSAIQLFSEAFSA